MVRIFDTNHAIARLSGDSRLAPHLTAAQEYGKIVAEQRAKGKPIPAADAQIAAVVRCHRLTLLSDDSHFAFVEGITVENPLA